MPDRLNAAEILKEEINRSIEKMDRQDGSYESLLQARRESYIRSGVPIRKDVAEELVRRHFCMPPNFGQNLNKKLLKKHFETTIYKEEVRTVSDDVMLSVEGFTRAEEIAKVDPAHFDGLLRAAATVLDPELHNMDFPTREHIFRWFDDVAHRRITRPTRRRKGCDPLKNLMRNLILHTIIKDLMRCGLPRHRNDATKSATPSACAVVAEVCGLATSTVRTAFDQVEKSLSSVGDDPSSSFFVSWQKLIRISAMQ